MKRGPERRHYPSPADPAYTLDEIEFLRAIDAYKRKHERPFPTWREVLGVLRELGWEKVGPTLTVQAHESSA